MKTAAQRGRDAFEAIDDFVGRHPFVFFYFCCFCGMTFGLWLAG